MYYVKKIRIIIIKFRTAICSSKFDSLQNTYFQSQLRDDVHMAIQTREPVISIILGQISGEYHHFNPQELDF